MNRKRTFLSLAAAASLVAAGAYPVILTDWFEQTFEGQADGTAFTGQGATGGSWDSIPTGSATVATVGGRKCVHVDTTYCTDAVRFVASRVPDQKVRRIDFSVSSEPTPWLPAVLDGDEGALSFASDDNGMLTFVGYTADGWVKMSCQGLLQRRAEWIDCRAEFEYPTATEAYVTYYARCGGRGYQPLADAGGNVRFPVRAASAVSTLSFSGTGAAGGFKGFEVKEDATRVYTWKGPTENDRRWENPKNWADYQSADKVPGNGDLAQLPQGKSIIYGKYTITAWAASEFSIVSNECLRISSGNIAIACEDGDYTSLGTVYAEAGTTLQTSGRYQGVEMAAGSTLAFEAVKGLEIIGEPFFLDGVNLELDVLGVQDDLLLVSAPYGSGGTPDSLSLPSEWSVAWHGRLDGATELWLAHQEDETDMAIWRRDGVPGNLVEATNWRNRAPGPGVAARMESGQAHVSRNDAFEFAKRFEIGHAGSGEVDMSGGSVLGRTEEAAVVVGANGGTGLLDVVGGTVCPYDYLWSYALTVGSGTNSTGTVMVRGGTVDATSGSVSVGAEGPASMLIEKGLVAVGDSMGVGNASTLALSGGTLAVNDSLYVGRATRGEAYDVKMTVSHGAVSNLSAGAIWVGSYGGVGSKAVLELTGGEIYATNRFICGGYRSAQVDVNGGTLVAPDICVGYDLIDEADVASFNLVSGRVETAGFTSGTNGMREVVLTGGELVAMATNDDFFAGLELVRLEGDTVLSNENDIVIRSALMGPGDFFKAGTGKTTVTGYAAWAGKTVIRDGVLDMAGGMVMGEMVIGEGAAVINAKYDEADMLFPFMTAATWTGGTLTTRPFVSVEFSMAADGRTSAVATDDKNVTKGALSSFLDTATGERAFLGWTALGWAELGFWDGTAVGTETYDLRMLFDFRAGKPYVSYYVKRGTEWERLISGDGLSCFPVAGDTMGIKALSGVAEYSGLELYVADGKMFYWIGPDGGEWNDGDNWSYTPGGPAAGKYPTTTKTSDSLAFVERPANISIGTAARTSLLMANDDVRLSGAAELSVSAAIAGVGRLSLSNATLHATGIRVPVDVPVIAESRTANRLLSTPSSCTFVLNGPLRGTGEITLTALNRRPKDGTILAGDNSAFGGVVKIYPYWSTSTHQNLDGPSIALPQASSASAQWEINVEHDYPNDMKPGTGFFGTAGATYRFGSLKANFYYTDAYNAYWATDGVTLEVGALDMDGFARGICAGKGGAIDWVAPTATFTNEVKGLSALRLIGGGRMIVAGEDALPSDLLTFTDRGGELLYDVNTDISGLITNSTAPVVFNGGDGWAEWSSAPGDSNVGGFVKRGAGTLVWYAAPTFRMDVSVEEGLLIVPFGTQLGRVAVADGAAIAVACSNAVENALVFSADSSNIRRLKEPYLLFLDVPEGYEISFAYGNDNAVVVSNGSRQFDWTGAAGDELWSTPGNWLVGKSVPDRSPAGMDLVGYGAGAWTTRLGSPAAAMTLDGSGDIVFTGSYALDVLLKFNLVGSLELRPEPMSSEETSADYYGAVTNVPGVSSVAEFSARTVRGEGFVSTGNKRLAVSSEDEETNRFVGMLRAGDFVKSGAGTFEFIGDGAFSGTVSVQQGTLRLGSYRDIDGIKMDFDASDEGSFEMDEQGNVLRWASRIGTNAFGYAGGQYAVQDKTHFGGRNAVILRPEASGLLYSRYDLAPTNAPGDVSKSLFLVYAPVGSSASYVYGQANDRERGLCCDASAAGLRWYCPKAEFGTAGIFTGAAYGSDVVSDGVPALTFWSDTALQGQSGVVETLGTSGNSAGFRGAVGEVVSFARTLTHVERDVTSRMLMCKWGVPGSTEFAQIHANTPVTMSAGATLDLGGQTFSVGSFTGAGTVTNGVLKTADGKVTQSGGVLSIPAVEGVTYVASNAGEKLIIRDAPGVKVTIVLQKGWFTAGNPGRRVIFCESKNIDWQIWNPAVRPVDEGDGWWSISGGGFAIRLR